MAALPGVLILIVLPVVGELTAGMGPDPIVRDQPEGCLCLCRVRCIGACDANTITGDYRDGVRMAPPTSTAGNPDRLRKGLNRVPGPGG
ncbi:hypothetical protein DSCA_57880 [Desulfosarcina alkanivorans]|uniref:Uncharacterized protein n=1 Tax=Desulfosarcina alkanivorans TaxID=571177 RepID=A0A5K7YTA3_9BACT|nr:hypothetical protein DSCA_57880 [Desulfosarcina alkanivorans]